MSTVIKVENLSKKFVISHQRKEKYTVLREELGRRVKKIFSFPFNFGKTATNFSKEEFWALRDVYFEINKGDRVGIIGRNGAGKSTLLKVLSRITEPTNGRITIRGRVASLLEVGTGFHPELTGRENIFLNGAILGMGRTEIRRKFDEIVAFAEVERFLDTPVKRYSSGMYVRLAFAVAAHLEPEILIVDEVLAVGDAQFQQKCLGKMEEVSRNEGRTVLFVSHNMGVITQLCERTIVLGQGSVLYNGDSTQAIETYLNSQKNKINKIEKTSLSEENQFITIHNGDSHGNEKSEYKFDDEIFLCGSIYVPEWSPFLELAVSLYDKHKRRVFTIHEPLNKYYHGSSKMSFAITIPSNFLTPGNYSWLMCLNYPGNTLYDLQDDICSFSILETGSDFSRYEKADYGCVHVNYNIKFKD